MGCPRLRVLAAALVAAAACGHAAPGPERTVERFAAAVEAGDVDAAYALMSDDYRARVDRAAFAARLLGGDGVKAAASRLRVAAPRAALRAEVDLGLGERLPLVFESGRWKVVVPTYDLYDQSTPRAALRAFIRAYRNQRWDVLLRLAPARVRDNLTVERIRDEFTDAEARTMRELVDALAAAVSNPIVEHPAEAHMPYGAGANVVFVREGGLWRIEEPQ